MGVAAYYEGWQRIQDRLTGGVATLSPEALALRGTDEWPIWAIVAHLAGARVYWLCTILGEPGFDTTPFAADADTGWEDDLTHPRSAAELLEALLTTWAIVQSCLDRWTEPMLAEAFERRLPSGVVQHHTRASVLTRLVSHDAYHTGEVSLILGTHGRPVMDPWTPPPPPS